MKRTSRRTRLIGLLASLTLLGVAVAGCSSGAGGNDAASDAPAGTAAERAAPAERNAAGSDSLAFDSGSDSGSGSAGVATQPVGNHAKPQVQSVISTGNVALRSRDVARARFDVQKVVDHYRGQVAEEQTDTDRDGEVRRSRLVIRIPTLDFAVAMDDLETTADLISSDTRTDDVTTEVIDNRVRLQIQRRSIARIEKLLDRAQSIGDIVSIESKLSSRQAVLGSLERQQAYLDDQTALSTITISVERTPAKKVVKQKDKDRSGFAAGLHAGWDGLTTIGVGVATVAGALLPFAVLALVLVLPGWPLARRLRRRRTTPGPVEA